jgi:hypothetical protein
MLDKIAIILPVRDGGTGRSERLKKCLDSYKDFTQNLSDVFILVDEDDVEKYKFLNNYDVEVLVVPHPKTLMEKINYYALDISSKYKYVGFVGDDIIFKMHWESEFFKFLSSVDFGLAYANDLIQDGRVPTHPFITSNMINALGFFGCPAVNHNFFDNYWLDMVRLVGDVKYFNEIIMEHNHQSLDNNLKDKIYFEIFNSVEKDLMAYREYMHKNTVSDAKKIKGFTNDV